MLAESTIFVLLLLLNFVLGLGLTGQGSQQPLLINNTQVPSVVSLHFSALEIDLNRTNGSVSLIAKNQTEVDNDESFISENEVTGGNGTGLEYDDNDWAGNETFSFDYDVVDVDPSQLFLPNPNRSSVGFWAVFDEMKQVVDLAYLKRPPSCILARMRATIELPDVLGFTDLSGVLNSTTNRTLWIPPDAEATNQTCWKDQQALVLTWNHTLNSAIIDRINLTLVFRQNISELSTKNYLSSVSIGIFHKELMNISGMADFVIEATGEFYAMEVPQLFAFCCRERMELPLDGKITYFGTNDVTEREEDISITLVLDQLCIEVFRQSRFYEDLTHLKYNCKSGWPYKFVQEAVVASLVLFIVVITAAFVVRYRNLKLERMQTQEKS